MHRRTLRSSTLSLLLPLALLLTLGSARSAHATDSATRRAKSDFRRGTDLYKQARYQEAIEAFRAAYDAKANAVIYFNIGQCEEKLGDSAAALDAYHRYLREAPDAKDRDNVETVIANLETRVNADKARPQKVVVSTEPADAQVAVDGHPQGTTPATFELTPGSHSLLVSKEHFAPVQRDVSVGREPLRVDLVLSPETVAPPLLSTGPTEKPVTKPPHARVWTWIALGAGGGALLAGGTMGLLASQSAKSLTGSQHDRATADSLQQQAKTRATTANVLYGVGGGLAAVGLTLFFVEGRF